MAQLLRWIAVIRIDNLALLYSEELHHRRDISTACGAALEPGTVWGKGHTVMDAIENAKSEAAKYAKTPQHGA